MIGGIIIDYDIVEGSGIKELVEIVKEKMLQGWYPIDPIFYIPNHGSAPKQKLVKYLKDPKFEEI